MSSMYLPMSSGGKLIPSQQVATRAWANVQVVLHSPPGSCVSSCGEFQPLPWPPSPATSRAGLSPCPAPILTGNKRDTGSLTPSWAPLTPRYKLLARHPASVQNSSKSQGCQRHLKSYSEFREGLSCSHASQLDLRHFKWRRISQTLGQNHFPKTALPCRASGWFPRIS